VEFKDTPGWLKPADLSVDVLKGETTTTTGTYIQISSLRVVIQPAGAVVFGAKWRRTGTTDWFDSGYRENGLPPGDYKVEFKDILRWTTPADVDVKVEGGRTALAIVDYYLVGSIRVNIAPPGAVGAGAQWRYDQNWHDNGVTANQIPLGSYKVGFKHVPGWLEPTTRTLQVSERQTAVTTGTYSQGGLLRVTILPPEAAAAGVKWRRVGTEEWFGAGQTESGLLTGDYVIEFKDVPPWLTPDNVDVTVVQGQTTDATGLTCGRVLSLSPFSRPTPLRTERSGGGWEPPTGMTAATWRTTYARETTQWSSRPYRGGASR